MDISPGGIMIELGPSMNMKGIWYRMNYRTKGKEVVRSPIGSSL